MKLFKQQIVKTVKLSIYAAAFSYLLTSCSSEETFTKEPVAENLIKSYTIKRDPSGAYYVDYTLADNTSVTSNNDSNTQIIAAYNSNHAAKTTNHSESLNLENDQLKVDFISENTNEKAQITIFDKDILLAKGNESNEMLAEYSITENKDNTFNLSFTVKENVIVDFVYNETSGEYEIHLEKGSSEKSQFNRVLEKQEGMPLVFSFFQHNSENTAARRFGPPGKGRPRAIILMGSSFPTSR